MQPFPQPILNLLASSSSSQRDRCNTHEVVQLDCGDAMVYAGDDFHGNGGGIDVVRIETIA